MRVTCSLVHLTESSWVLRSRLNGTMLLYRTRNILSLCLFLSAAQHLAILSQCTTHTKGEGGGIKNEMYSSECWSKHTDLANVCNISSSCSSALLSIPRPVSVFYDEPSLIWNFRVLLSQSVGCTCNLVDEELFATSSAQPFESSIEAKRIDNSLRSSALLESRRRTEQEGKQQVRYAAEYPHWLEVAGCLSLSLLTSLYSSISNSSIPARNWHADKEFHRGEPEFIITIVCVDYSY